MFFSPFSIAITSLGEERANLSAFRTFVLTVIFLAHLLVVFFFFFFFFFACLFVCLIVYK